ncbi:hypothetical protein IQ06DRAFT_340329 [Phaeosphaeriaceae sp. SRC1lsM3a]|nr:hypothetical protein IQ06DRAFT_340329 [Stagonospora sp. SRC1lsM3a]
MVYVDSNLGANGTATERLKDNKAKCASRQAVISPNARIHAPSRRVQLPHATRRARTPTTLTTRQFVQNDRAYSRTKRDTADAATQCNDATKQELAALDAHVDSKCNTDLWGVTPLCSIYQSLRLLPHRSDRTVVRLEAPPDARRASLQPSKGETAGTVNAHRDLISFARLGDVHSLENISGTAKLAVQAMQCSAYVGGAQVGPRTPNSKLEWTEIDGRCTLM